VNTAYIRARKMPKLDAVAISEPSVQEKLRKPMSGPFNISSIDKTLSSLNLLLPAAGRDLRETQDPSTIAATLLLERGRSSVR
jgi:hypothetical protein